MYHWPCTVNSFEPLSQRNCQEIHMFLLVWIKVKPAWSQRLIQLVSCDSRRHNPQSNNWWLQTCFWLGTFKLCKCMSKLKSGPMYCTASALRWQTMSKSKPTLEGAKPLGRCELVIILYCTVITRIPKSLLSSMLDLSIRLCHGKTMMHEISLVFIRPESDHWLPLSLLNSLTDSVAFSRLDWCDPGV